MSTGDWIALCALIFPGIGAMGALLKWFGNHSERLRTAEVKIEHLERRQSEDIAWIRDSMKRIEDKLDKKVDR